MRKTAPVRNARRRGVSLVELMIALMVIAIALMALIGALVEALRFDRMARENAIATNVIRTIFEDMRNRPFNGVYATYNANPSDDPAGFGTAPGNIIDENDEAQIPGITALLSPLAPPRTGNRCQVFLPGNGTDLRETVVDALNDPRLGIPRDLNGDGDATDTSGINTTYMILPVRVVLRWTGPRGQVSTEATEYLAP